MLNVFLRPLSHIASGHQPAVPCRGSLPTRICQVHSKNFAHGHALQVAVLGAWQRPNIVPIFVEVATMLCLSGCDRVAWQAQHSSAGAQEPGTHLQVAEECKGAVEMRVQLCFRAALAGAAAQRGIQILRQQLAWLVVPHVHELFECVSDRLQPTPPCKASHSCCYIQRSKLTLYWMILHKNVK